MNDVSQLLERIETGDPRATEELLPIVYDELRRLARRRLAHEAAGQSLQSADLVHEAYLRLVGSRQEWHGRGHFFAAAAEAMRRILVERARRKRRIKHGGRFKRVGLSDAATRLGPAAEEIISISDLLDVFGKQHPLEAVIVKLHYFGGLSIRDVAKVVGVSTTTAHRQWKFARAWLQTAIRAADEELPRG